MAAKLREVYGAAVNAVVAEGKAEQLAELADADAAYGSLDAALLATAPNLTWCQCPMAAPPQEYFFPELVASRVEVTNMRGIYDEELSVHILTLMLAVNRQLGEYRDMQNRREYRRLTFNRGEYTPDPEKSDFRVDVPSATGE
jgi:phosphoglycerate dehydrogenase-like enzyme